MTVVCIEYRAEVFQFIRWDEVQWSLLPGKGRHCEKKHVKENCPRKGPVAVAGWGI